MKRFRVTLVFPDFMEIENDENLNKRLGRALDNEWPYVGIGAIKIEEIYTVDEPKVIGPHKFRSYDEELGRSLPHMAGVCCICGDYHYSSDR